MPSASEGLENRHGHAAACRRGVEELFVICIRMKSHTDSTNLLLEMYSKKIGQFTKIFVPNGSLQYCL